MSKLIQTHYDNPAIKLPSFPSPSIVLLGKREVDDTYEITLSIDLGEGSETFDKIYFELWETTNEHSPTQITVIRQGGTIQIVHKSETYTDDTTIKLVLDGYYLISSYRLSVKQEYNINLNSDYASLNLVNTETNVCRDKQPEITIAPSIGIERCGYTANGYYLHKEEAIKTREQFNSLDIKHDIYFGTSKIATIPESFTTENILNWLQNPCQIVREQPIEANTSANLIIVLLEQDPLTKYNGYVYLIKEDNVYNKMYFGEEEITLLNSITRNISETELQVFNNIYPIADNVGDLKIITTNDSSVGKFNGYIYIIAHETFYVTNDSNSNCLIIPVYTASNYGIRQGGSTSIEITYTDSNNEAGTLQTVLNNLSKAYIIIQDSSIITNIQERNALIKFTSTYNYKGDTTSPQVVSTVLELI